jgi:hypothetical protein
MDRLFQEKRRAQFFLVDDQDEVESFQRLDDLIETIRGLGIKFAEIHLGLSRLFADHYHAAALEVAHILAEGLVIFLNAGVPSVPTIR